MKSLLIGGLVLFAKVVYAQPLPQFTPKTFSIPGNYEGRYKTEITVQAGDYLYIEVTGHIKVGPWLGYAGPEGIGQFTNTYDQYDKVHLKEFRHGALICSIGNRNRVCTKAFGDLTKFYQRLIMLEAWLGSDLATMMGWIFVSETSGPLSFEINDGFPENNSEYQAFKVSVTHMTKAQHFYRNNFNKCPRQAPKVTDTYGEVMFIDRKDHVWEKDLDMVAEKYHGGQLTFRGRSIDVLGSQCTYNNTTKQLANPPRTMGTFDYANALGEGLKRHFILDVFPHELYPNWPYTATPVANTY